MIVTIPLNQPFADSSPVRFMVNIEGGILWKGVEIDEGSYEVAFYRVGMVGVNPQGMQRKLGVERVRTFLLSPK